MVKFKDKQAAIQEKRWAEELEKQMPDIIKRANQVAEEIRKAEEKKQPQRGSSRCLAGGETDERTKAAAPQPAASPLGSAAFK
jgi:hypothetical protein